MNEHSTSTDAGWTLRYDHWDPQAQPLREALCTLGNGRFATRGAAEEAEAGGPHYPGTYLAGGYDRAVSEIAGRQIENEDLVNWPNWLCLQARCSPGAWFDPTSADLVDYAQTLDLRQGLLSRRWTVCDRDHRRTHLESRRWVHMANPHLAAIQWQLTPENWSGRVEICSALDGAVSNAGVDRYRELNGAHLRPLGSGRSGEDGIYLAVESQQSQIQMVQAARTQLFCRGDHAVLERQTTTTAERAEQRIMVDCERGQPIRIEKMVAISTSRDFAISHPRLAACEAIAAAGTFDQLLASHRIAWDQLWHRADIEIGSQDPWSQLILRLHIFHLLQTVSLNSIDRDTGVPARGWHGEAYRGHIFWDELFIFPFLNLRIPELTRSLLMYRYRRLPAARQLAAAAGYRGAMYPWQSGSSGREESQVLHLNPQSGRWLPDNSHRQRHINAAIAYNVWQYFQVTDDKEFLSFYGAEMLLEIARFWASIAEYNAQRDRYEIRQVMGPDEFHTGYPDAPPSSALDNNAYTNVMAAWCLRCALRAFATLAEDQRAELTAKLALTDEEFRRFEQVSQRLYVPFHDGDIISQFEGYESLLDFDWTGYREKYDDIQRLDRILESEGDSPNRYQASKQADVLMLFYLFSAPELQELFSQLGYPFDTGSIPRNIDYYLARTSHGSTLSRVVHAWVLARRDRKRSWELFQQALQSDVGDIQGGTTAEGIHLGAMAGTVDVIQRCHCGVEIRDDVLWLNPCLPRDLSSIRQRLRYRGQWFRLEITDNRLLVQFEVDRSSCPAAPASIGVGNEIHTFCQGESREFRLNS